MNRPLWHRGEGLESVRVERPSPGGDDSWETVLVEPVGDVAESSLPKYTLVTDVPAHWYPMTATDTGADDYRLEIALLMDADTLDGTVSRFPRPMGEVLDPEATVHDEAVTDQGTTVARRYTLALGADGRGYCWSGRTVTTGRGRASSGLRDDVLTDAEASDD